MPVIRSVKLECHTGGSNKEYHIRINQQNVHLFNIETSWGPCGNPYEHQVKGIYDNLMDAEAKFNKVYATRISHEYQVVDAGINLAHQYDGEEQPAQIPAQSVTPAPQPRPTQPSQGRVVSTRRRIAWDGDPELQSANPVPLTVAAIGPSLVAITTGSGEKIQTGNLPQLPTEMGNCNTPEEQIQSQLEHLLHDDGWGLQEKMDGVHEMLDSRACDFSAGDDNTGLVLTNKKGIVKGPDPEFLHALNRALAGKPKMLIDGEHIGCMLHVYDIHDSENCPIALTSQPYAVRHMWLERYFASRARNEFEGKGIRIVPLYTGREKKREMFNYFRDNGFEGVIFKRLSSKMTAGKKHTDMIKYKFYSTVSVRVREGRPGKRSVGMELLSEGLWVDMGNVTIPPNKEIPQIGSIIEVRVLYCFKGGHLFQPVYIGSRDDIDDLECLLSQVKYKR